MSTQQEIKPPTQDEIRAARHQGFDDSVAPIADDKRSALTDSYRAQDARRESNISNFYGTVLGNGES